MATRKTFLTIDEYRESGLFKDEANDSALEKLLIIASQKIDMVSDLGLADVDNPAMTQDQLDALKEATSIVVDHWNSGGWDWKKASGSASISSLSASISRMDNNDIVPQIALDILQRQGLYDPFEIISMCDGIGGGSSGGGITPGPSGTFSPEQIAYLIQHFATIGQLGDKQNKLPSPALPVGSDDYIYINKFGNITVDKIVDVLTRNGYTPGGGGKGGIDWLTDDYANINDFAQRAPDYKMVKFNINPNGTNNKEGITILVKTPGGLKHFVTMEEIDDLLQANDWELIKPINDFSFNQPASGGALSYAEHYGSLDSQAERKNFMDHALINYWYTFTIGGVPYEVCVVSGDKTTNFIWSGKRIIDGPTGAKAPQFVTGSVSLQGHSEQAGPFLAEVYSPSIALPGAYPENANLPKGTIAQMIIDYSKATVLDPADPTWRDVPGTQSLQFNPSQITITLNGADEITQGNYLQFLLGSNVGNTVLDGAVQVYDDPATAALNGNVAGQYKWYAYKQSTDTLIFVMEDSKSKLANNAQTIFKMRNVSPDVQEFTAHYSSQAAILKGAVDIKTLTKGTSRIIDLPTGLTINTLTGVSVTVGASTDWYILSGWDKVSPFYASVTTEDTNNIWWVELKVEAVPGDDTKLKVTNFDSGNLGTQGANYNAHWIAFKGGR